MTKTILNVGGGSRNLPEKYNGWKQILVDIDPNVNPDVCCDALELQKYISIESIDAVYCSHAIEHFYKHDIPKLLAGFHYVLKNDGFVELHTPNFKHMIQELISRNLDVHDVWYRVYNDMPITFHDTIHGWNKAMEKGNLFYAHRCSFTPVSLNNDLLKANFKDIKIFEEGGNLMAVAYKNS